MTIGTNAGSRAPPARGRSTGDDAVAARWTPLADLRRETTFGDHFQIIRIFADRIGEPAVEEP